MNEEAKEKISCSNYDQCESCFLGHECERVVVVEQLIKDSNSKLLERLERYIDHEETCILNSLEAGEATKNGYRQKFNGKWYEARPKDKTPKCDCGLDETLSLIQELKNEL